MLLGEGIRERRAGDEAALDDDLAQTLTRATLVLERLPELLLGEESGRDENPAELRCWKLSRVHDSNIGFASRFVRPRYLERLARRIFVGRTRARP